MTGTKTEELDYEGAPPGYAYDGTGGIPMGNALQRALFAWRYRDMNLLISGQISATSRIMIYRDLAARVPKPVPFLTFDADPYLSISAGRMVWIWDAYTSSNQYPYSQSVNLGRCHRRTCSRRLGQLHAQLGQGGGRRLQRHDDLLRRHGRPVHPGVGRAFPDLFTPIDEAPSDLQAHFRYPENLFQVQATQFANYHVTNPRSSIRSRTAGRSPPTPPNPTGPPRSRRAPRRLTEAGACVRTTCS